MGSYQEAATAHYDQNYFKWQSSIGEFGGWANSTKFNKFIAKTDRVLDFGCGGGFLLRNLACAKRIGVEINPAAQRIARDNGVEVFTDAAEVPNASVDVIVSNHALEHCESPLNELRKLHPKLVKGGKIVFVVPCETYRYGLKPNDINQHLYTWSPMCLGNLFQKAGFQVISAEPYIHKWPPFYRYIAKFGGRFLFDLCARVYARLERSHFQVRVVATKA